MSFKNVPEELNKKYNYPQLWGIVRGKWVVESVDELFKENDIYIDYSVRGVITKEHLQKEASIKLNVPLEELVGKEIESKIRKFETINLLKRKLHLRCDADYLQYRIRQAHYH